MKYWWRWARGLGLMLVLAAAGCSDGGTAAEGVEDSAGGGGAGDALGDESSGPDGASGEEGAVEDGSTDGAGGESGAEGDGGEPPEEGGGESDGSGSGDGGGGESAPDEGEGGAAPDPFDDPSIAVVMEKTAMTLVNGSSPPFSFEVPENAQSITVIVEGQSDEMYTLGRWQDSTDLSLVQAGWYASGDPSLCLSCNNRVAASEGVFAALAPIQPTSQAVPGTHVMSAYGFRLEGSFFQQKLVPSNATVEVSIYVKVLPEAPAEGTLHLNLYFTGANGWTAATAPTNAEFQAILDEVRVIYGTVGVSLGRITYQDVDPVFQTIESVQGADSDFMELLEQSEGQESNALNVFFVNELSMGGPFGDFGVLLGVAGGIPGPSLRQGTVKSGVAIAVKPVPEIPAGVDTTMAHEVGHFLGLFHTSEQNFGGFGPSIHDPLPDTPENDESYLMFNTGSGHKLSEWQGRVMRSSLWVRHGEEAKQ